MVRRPTRHLLVSCLFLMSNEMIDDIECVRLKVKVSRLSLLTKRVIVDSADTIALHSFICLPMLPLNFNPYIGPTPVHICHSTII